MVTFLSFNLLFFILFFPYLFFLPPSSTHVLFPFSLISIFTFDFSFYFSPLPGYHFVHSIFQNIPMYYISSPPLRPCLAHFSDQYVWQHTSVISMFGSTVISFFGSTLQLSVSLVAHVSQHTAVISVFGSTLQLVQSLICNYKTSVSFLSHHSITQTLKPTLRKIIYTDSEVKFQKVSWKKKKWLLLESLQSFFQALSASTLSWL